MAQVEPVQQGLDDDDRAADAGGTVGDHVGIEETIGDPDDREGQRGSLQAGVERAAASAASCVSSASLASRIAGNRCRCVMSSIRWPESLGSDFR